MKKVSMMAAIAVTIGLLNNVNALAWEVKYDANAGVLPTAASPAWQLSLYKDPTPTISDGVLHIQHLAAGNYVEYSREYAINAGVPVTMEARMRVAASSSTAVRMSIQTKSASAGPSIYPDHLWAPDWGGYGPVTFYEDFTIFRTIRLAYDGGTREYCWVDNQLAFSFALSGSAGQDGINFGSYIAASSSDSYWQYVAYSKEFLPVPEPSSLAAIPTLSLLAAGGVLGKRRR